MNGGKMSCGNWVHLILVLAEYMSYYLNRVRLDQKYDYFIKYFTRDFTPKAIVT